VANDGSTGQAQETRRGNDANDERTGRIISYLRWRGTGHCAFGPSLYHHFHK